MFIKNKPLTFAESINLSLYKNMTKNKNLICFGLGINDPTRFFGTTNNLVEKFGIDRVFETPTSENAMTGIGIGLSINNYPCVMMHQRLDFFLLAMDQLVNNAAKWHYMFGGQKSVPITIRLVIGKGWGQGPTHSQNLQSWFSHIPGLKVVAPSTPMTAFHLLNESIKDKNPVIFIEHRWLHQTLEKKNLIKKFKIGKARYLNRGHELTIVTNSLSTLELMELNDCLVHNNIKYDHIDLLTIKPMDFFTIKKSLLKTKKLLVLDTTSNKICSIGSEIISIVARDKDITLKKPPILLSLPDIPAPTSFYLTKNYYVSKKNIVDAICHLTRKKISFKLDNTYHDIPNAMFRGPF
jgi:pyruvate/2-oxoglutarate/acetoin dehydrogenase E1 component